MGSSACSAKSGPLEFEIAHVLLSSGVKTTGARTPHRHSELTNALQRREEGNQGPEMRHQEQMPCQIVRTHSGMVDRQGRGKDNED